MSEQKAVANTLLAAWLAEQYPEVFNELLVRSTNPTGAPRGVNVAPPPVGLSGFTDTLSSIWGGITSAASSVASAVAPAIKSVGSFLGSQAGQNVLATAVALKYGSTSNQAAVIGTQVNRSQAGQTPAPIQTVYDASTGTYVPVLNQNTNTGVMQYPVSSSILDRLQPSFIDRYGPWMIGAGIALVIVATLSARRS